MYMYMYTCTRTVHITTSTSCPIVYEQDTHSCTGIGAATAHAFARAGCTRLAITDINASLLAETASAITAAYPSVSVLALAGDISSEAFVESFFDAVVDRFGRVDYAVNCAGILGKAAPSAEMDVAEFDRVNGVNYRGLWLCGRRELRVMMGQEPLDSQDDHDGSIMKGKIPPERGSIVHIASQLGIVGRPEAREYPYLHIPNNLHKMQNTHSI